MANATVAKRRDRIVQKIATLAVSGVYRTVALYRYDTDDAPGGAQLSVANHFGGFADPLLLVSVLPRVPRIVARDVIWKVPVAGWLMRWLRGIPVHKPTDRGPGSNDEMFASAYEALGDGAHVMIFPEGITRDEPSIAPLKTGAARIVLGARAQGVEGIRITPVGIHYDDKAALRSDVSIQVGRSMDLDAAIDQHVAPSADAGPDNRTVVRALTDDLEARLRQVAPDFADWQEARTLTRGAEILLRSVQSDPARPVPLAARDRVAGRLAHAADERRRTAVAAVTEYVRDLSQLRITDAQLHSGMTTGRLLWRLVGRVLLALVLAPFAAAGALINWLPYLVVRVVGLLPLAPAVLATVVPMSAIVVFGAAWGFTVWGAFQVAGVGGAALAVLLMPVYLAAVIVFAEAVVDSWRALRTWWRLRASAPWEQAISERRRAVVDALVEAL